MTWNDVYCAQSTAAAADYISMSSWRLQCYSAHAHMLNVPSIGRICSSSSDCWQGGWKVTILFWFLLKIKLSCLFNSSFHSMSSQLRNSLIKLVLSVLGVLRNSRHLDWDCCTYCRTQWARLCLIGKYFPQFHKD